jgi:hypothetical protein
MKTSTYKCDGCGKEKRGIPQAEQKYTFNDGEDGIPEDWSQLWLKDFGTPIRACFRHYCPGCTKRVLAIINSPLPQP